jgi:hypothetical protein
VSSRFEERKLVDRAKGILMRARQVSEDEAFRVLRAASMHSNSVSAGVAAGDRGRRFAEAINRAGSLRMLSQRLVKLHGAVRAVGAAAASLERRPRVSTPTSRRCARACRARPTAT